MTLKKTRITGVVLREAPFPDGPAVYEYVNGRVLSWADAEERFPTCTAQWDAQQMMAGRDDNIMLTIIGPDLAAVIVANGRIVSWYARWNADEKTWRVGSHMMARSR